MTAFAALFEALSEVEEYLIRGMVYVLDISGITLSYLKIATVEHAMKIAKNSEKCLSGRHKGFHFVNVAPALAFAFNLGLKHAPEKARNRVKFYSSFDQLDFIAKENLPKEYGGTIPMEEMSSKNVRQTVLCQPNFLNFQNQFGSCC